MTTTAEYHLSLFRRDQNRVPYIFGHRGAPLLAPENTIVSFEKALEEGADGVEFDVRMSADGALFIAHNDEIELRNTARPVSLCRLTSGQIEKLPTKSGEPIPSLRDGLSFQASTGARLNIELKGDVPGPGWMARTAAKQINAHGGAHVLLSSFSPLIVFALNRALPNVPVALLFDKEQHWMKRCLPLSLLGAQGAHPEAAVLDAALAKRIRDKAPIMNSWTVNDPAEAHRLAALGVDALITDEPRILREAFDSMSSTPSLRS